MIEKNPENWQAIVINFDKIELKMNVWLFLDFNLINYLSLQQM